MCSRIMKWAGILPAMLAGGLLFAQARAAGTYGLKRAELEFHVGPSIPLGSFSRPSFSGLSEDGVLEYHGARVGVNYGLSFGYYLSPDWGILLLFNGHSNKMRPEPFSSYNSQWPWEVETADKWTEFMAMAGASYRVQPVDRLVLAFRAYIGYAHLISPFYRSAAVVSNGRYTFKLNSDSDASFGFGAGVALKFLVSRGFHLDLRCEYMGVAPFRFDNVGGEVSMENAAFGSETVLHSSLFSFRENFQMLNVGIGFTASF